MKLNKEFLQKNYPILIDIRDSDMSFKAIAKKYGVKMQNIYHLNSGDYSWHTLYDEEFTFPLRETGHSRNKKIIADLKAGISPNDVMDRYTIDYPAMKELMRRNKMPVGKGER
jgi:uncharacterized protein (DUF433 family)